VITFLQDAAGKLSATAQGLKKGAQSVRHGNSRGLLHVLMGLGFVGVLVVSTMDASFIPLPIPGCTDIVLIILAARQYSWLGLIAVSTLGSMIGGYTSYRVGAAGGVHMLEKRIPKKHFARICHWVENHTLLAVAIPALMPPPMPLSIFVLAAGALKIPRRKFFSVFAIARCVRYSFCVWIGVTYGRRFLHEWNSFSAQWGKGIGIGVWVIIGGAVLYTAWYMWRHAKQDRESRSKTVWKELAEDG
jgi:membrane protein YqaA with SNARE-associated domain